MELQVRSFNGFVNEVGDRGYINVRSLAEGTRLFAKAANQAGISVAEFNKAVRGVKHYGMKAKSGKFVVRDNWPKPRDLAFEEWQKQDRLLAQQQREKRNREIHGWIWRLFHGN